MLVRGERGTAKSTAVRALAPLLPPVLAAVGETYAFGPGAGCARRRGRVRRGAAAAAAPLVELPLGATLDRLVGALDLRRALAGEQVFEPGMLARAHQGILYVDEVNLLADHLVDALLDAAASGVARVEREAVSRRARRPLHPRRHHERRGGRAAPAAAGSLRARASRYARRARPVSAAEIVRRRLAFERDPAAFVERYAEDERALAARIAARARAPRRGAPARARAAADRRRLRASWASTACVAISSPRALPERSPRSTAQEEVERVPRPPRRRARSPPPPPP